MLKVYLLSHTPDPEKAVAAAARLCYSPRSAQQLYENLTDKEVQGLIDKLRTMGHTSTFEHAQFTFGIDGISRTLSHQLVRHRIASYSQKSQRYVNEGDFQFIIPPSIENNKEARALYLEKMQGIQRAYQELAQVVPKEDARYLLPNGVETKIVASFNARSLLNFFTLRCCNRAQWEIRALAYEMLALVKQIAPNIFALAGPGCVAEGVCDEGTLSCGRVLKLNTKIKE